jgi:hypothetical protein
MNPADVAAQLQTIAEQIVALAAQLLPEPEPVPTAAPWVDITAQMPTNPNASNPAAHPGYWGNRTPEQTTGITIHHTLSNDPIATAQWIVSHKSLPTTEYAVWVRENGEALLCVPTYVDFWHDNTGYPNHHVSVGLAGNRTHGISQAQLDGLVRVTAYLMEKYGLTLSQVRGHCDYVSTACPGWNAGGWKAQFYAALGEATL